MIRYEMYISATMIDASCKAVYPLLPPSRPGSPSRSSAYEQPARKNVRENLGIFSFSAFRNRMPSDERKPAHHSGQTGKFLVDNGTELFRDQAGTLIPTLYPTQGRSGLPVRQRGRSSGGNFAPPGR